MKKIVFPLLLSLVLVGCEEEQPKGVFENVTVKDKRMEESCAKGCWNDYFVTFEKNNTTVELEVETENMYNLFKEGNEVTVTYDDDYFVMDVKFPNLEKDVDKHNK